MYSLLFLFPLLSSFISPSLSLPTTSPFAQNITDTALIPHIITTYARGTWLENLAISQSSGQILATLLSTPEIHYISTTNTHPPIPLATIPNTLGCLGIVELGLDIFYVVAGNLTLDAVTSTPGSYSIWRLDLTHFDASLSNQSSSLPSNHSAPGFKLSKLVDIPQAGFLNGLAVSDPIAGTVLAADSLYSSVWAINVFNGSVSLAINDTTMSPTPDAAVALGINAILVREDGYLYYDNTDRASFNRIPIDVTTGKTTGPAETLLQSDTSKVFPDDFAIDERGNAWMTADADALSELDFLPDVTKGGDVGFKVVSGAEEDGRVLGWTAAKFGTTEEDLKRGSLYVTTNGGPTEYVYQNWTVGGMVVRVDTADLEM
ncbi:hypothetical protein MMC10_006701 [Thelotrema lepadinum]|nr:hypothetical protein [Thelotrema lepadinum]